MGYLALLVISFFIPNGFIIFYSNYVALIGAALFILVQLVLLVDFAHIWSENCVANWEETEAPAWMWILIISTGGMFLGSLLLTLLMYIFFGQSGCGLNQFFITANLILFLVVSFIAIHPKVQEANPQSGLSQAAMVSIYSTYLVISAVSNAPVGPDESHCNPVSKSRGTEWTTAALGALFTFLALVYSTSRAATRGRALISGMQYEAVSANEPTYVESQPSHHAGMRQEAIRAAVESGALPPSALHSSQQQDEDDSGGAIDDEVNAVAYNYTFFHIVFAMASMYVSMLITNWNSVSGKEDNIFIGQSSAAVWVKIVSGWVCIVLYGWTLVGPLVLTDREWY